MTIKQIFKILNSHDWKEEESQVAFHILDHWKTCYLQGKNAYRKKLYTVCVYLFVNNYTYEEAPVDEAKKTLDWTFKKYKEDKNYLIRKYREFFRIFSEVKKIFKDIREKGLDNLADKELKNLFIKINKLGKDQYGYALLPEGIDTLTEKDYLSFLPGIDAKDAPEIIRILSTPEELSFFEKEKISILELAAEVLGYKGLYRKVDTFRYNKKLKKAVDQGLLEEVKKFPTFWKKLNGHTQNYFWIQNSFRKAIYLDNRHFLNSISELTKTMHLSAMRQEIKKLRNKKKLSESNIKKISRKYKLSFETRLFFELLRSFSFLQDSRKEIIQRLVFSIDQILKEIAKRFDVPRMDLDNYFVPEVIELLENGKKVSKKSFKKRKKAAFFSYINGNEIKTDVLFGKEAQKIIDFFKKEREKIASAGVIKGFVASLGKGEKIIEGRVRIVFDPHKDIFKEGEILVTGMTRPEFVPLMKKAKAIVTNEGGITTHAAIISRELKIPCIIGTKIATDVFKTKDAIELDLEKGIIKKLKRI